MLNQKLIELAKDVSKESDFHQYKLGAIIFKRNKVLSIGCNTCKGNPMQLKYNRYRNFEVEDCRGCSHAEMSALRSLIKVSKKSFINFNNLSIFIYREHIDGTYGLAKPCPACEKALREFGITNVYYTGEHSIVHEKYL